MPLRVVGAGLPRTGTRSLQIALERLLGGRCYHMHYVFRHPEDVPVWRAAIRGEEPDWRTFPPDSTAAVDWPASAFWRELSAANRDAIVLLSTRASAQEWWESVDETILGVARREPPPELRDWQPLFHELLVRELGEPWDDPARAHAFYERHNAEVRDSVPTGRLVEWRAEDGWAPLCDALGLPTPDEPFPHTNTRFQWRISVRPLEPEEVDRVGAVLGLARLHDESGVYLVAWDGDEPLGHAHLAGSDPPELQDVAVRPEYRRRGVATALSSAAERESRRRGFDRLRLTVSVDNEAAQALYRKLGYVDAGVPPRRVVGTIQIRTGPIEVDDTLLTWEKAL